LEGLCGGHWPGGGAGEELISTPKSISCSVARSKYPEKGPGIQQVMIEALLLKSRCRMRRSWQLGCLESSSTSFVVGLVPVSPHAKQLKGYRFLQANGDPPLSPRAARIPAQRPRGRPALNVTLPIGGSQLNVGPGIGHKQGGAGRSKQASTFRLVCIYTVKGKLLLYFFPRFV
jgi:hypothetical protein